MDDDDEEPIISLKVLKAIDRAFETELADLHEQGQGDFADGMNNDDDFDMFRAGYLDKFRGDPQQENMPPAYQMGFQAGRKMDKGAGRRMKKGGASRRPDYYEEKEDFERRRTEPQRLDTEYMREVELLQRQLEEEEEIARIQQEELEEEEENARIQQEEQARRIMEALPPANIPDISQEDEDMMDRYWGIGRPMKFGFLQRRPNRCQ